MLEFKTPELSDKKWVDELLSKVNKKSCELCFGNMYIWSVIYSTEITKFKKSLVIRYKIDGEYSYFFSYSGENITELIDELILDAERNNQKLIIYGLTNETKNLIESNYPDCFEIIEKRDYFDYVYNTEDLINLSGRKYHQKRNHISFFKKNYDWSYEPINENNLEECRVFNSQWERHNSSKNPEELFQENLAIQTALDNYSALGFTGGLLRVNGKIEAYTLGEPLSDEMFCTHIEKANADMRGAYPMINQQFTENELASFKFINREEDTGSDGLRQAKMSYNPAFLIESYFARYKK